MICSLTDLKNKEVINIKNGAKLGFVDDIEINTDDAAVLALIVFGRPRFFGLFGRDDDIIIKCTDIELIGEDTILVAFDDISEKSKKRSFNFESLLK
ncbi:MAG: YlmC/YmxH family sporulation protein [Oscillospiraceae bacterium]|jgi:YlmC/YmxH family sporulation protein